MHRLKPGIRVNGTYYCDVVLRLLLLLNIRAASGSEFFVFQQDSAPITSRQRGSSAAGSRDA